MDERERAQFRADAERIARRVIAMSDEEVRAYLVEHGLQDFVSEENIDKLLTDAMVQARRRSFRVID